MMNRHRHIRAVACPVLAALALGLPPLAAHADVARTGAEPWYQESTPEARAQANALFTQAVGNHQQLLRREAMALYEQALALWDNPDIRWNLALELDDLGEYQRAHEQLEGAMRWGAALGVERSRQVQDRMRVLETQRLARIDADGAEPGTDATLDGRPWFQGAGQHSTRVLPGTHYIAATRPGYFPITVRAPVLAGERYHVTLRMTADQVFETRRWSAWKPWAVVAAGVAVATAGAALERDAFARREDAGKALDDHCASPGCAPAALPKTYERARLENRLAIGAFAAGGAALVAGLALVWLDRPQAHRDEVVPSSFELMPAVSPGRVGVSAAIRF
jgi:hypothetical protein